MLSYTAMTLSGDRSPALAIAVLALALGGCASSYDTRLTDHSVKYLGVGDVVIDPSAKESLALRKSYWDGAGITA